MDFFLVGGMVRDEIMNVRSRDADFTVVLGPEDMGDSTDPFDVMRQELVRRGFKIFVESPEHFTIRAQFPKGDNAFGVRDADFVLAREEGPYSDGRRPDWVKSGTLLMDQQRRDFTMNAIAKAEDGRLIDPFGGVNDIHNGLIRCVGNPGDRFEEDALRILRAMRFSITKGFRMADSVEAAIRSNAHRLESVSKERQREELTKMFKADTLASLNLLMQFPVVMSNVLDNGLWLKPTLEK